MAQPPADDDFEDIRIVPPPTAPTVLPLDTDPLSYDDDLPLSSASQSSLSSPSTSSLPRALLSSWQAELHCPSLLPYASTLIPSLLSHLNRARHSLPSLPPSPHQPLLELELARLDYLLADYHRIRLAKIERHCLLLTQGGEGGGEVGLGLLSAAERRHVKGYAALWSQVMREEGLGKVEGVWPKGRELEGTELVEGWDRAAHVVLRAVERLGTVDLSEEGEEEPLELNKGDIVIARYQEQVEQLLHQGRIQLL